ncbi:MAG: toll/interleukin-1 receptor domain-containing protein, partial [Proteobacteria bacterium]|nr:toll/interleukin-1 receptor domain-containing protein [Pseudomonadota bacterium]
MPGKVFVSYSHKDEKWKDRVTAHLGVLARAGLLQVWDDRRISAGDDWKAEIQAAMDGCTVALLLVSVNFLNSGFILDTESPALLKRRFSHGVRVIPVILEHCAWTAIDWLNGLQGRPTDGKPLSDMPKAKADKALAALALEILNLSKGAPPAGPFVDGGSGSRPLSPKVDLDHLPRAIPDFLGRGAELGALDAAWDDVSGTSVFVIVAPGGTGKTSLIQRWLTKLNQPRHGWSRSVLRLLDRLRNRTGLECAWLRHRLCDWRGAARVFGWSFYSQGTAEDRQASEEPFFAAALAFFGVTVAATASIWDKAAALARAVRTQRTLLILDGLEP